MGCPPADVYVGSMTPCRRQTKGDVMEDRSIEFSINFLLRNGYTVYRQDPLEMLEERLKTIPTDEKCEFYSCLDVVDLIAQVRAECAKEESER